MSGRELSYEYRHGVTSYGAFTYSLGEILRRSMLRGRSITLHTLCTRVAQRLHELEYEQTPLVLGPKKILRAPLSWRTK